MSSPKAKTRRPKPQTQPPNAHHRKSQPLLPKPETQNQTAIPQTLSPKRKPPNPNPRHRPQYLETRNPCRLYRPGRRTPPLHNPPRSRCHVFPCGPRAPIHGPRSYHPIRPPSPTEKRQLQILTLVDGLFVRPTQPPTNLSQSPAYLKWPPITCCIAPKHVRVGGNP